MSCDEKGARYYIHQSIDNLTRSYALTGARYFYSQVEAQVAVYLLDNSNTQFRAFQAQWGSQVITDVDECDAWLSGVLSKSQSQAIQNLPYWLTYALQQHRKWADWEQHARVFAHEMPAQAAAYLVSPVLKRVLEQLENILPLALSVCERKQDDWTSVATDAHRVMRRTALYAPCVDQLDYAVANILFDALLNGDSSMYNDMQALHDRLAHMRQYTKATVNQRLKKAA
jgi:hypothetical protein